MKHLLIITALVLSSHLVLAQEIEKIDKNGLLELTARSSDTTYVVNFWATWCSPCVREIGYFEEVHREFPGSRVKVILVSLDFPNQLERRVVPFIQDKEITAPVKLMTDLNYNDWIDRVDPSWSGAIPATLIFNRKNRIFLEKELTKDELLLNVNQIMN